MPTVKALLSWLACVWACVARVASQAPSVGAASPAQRQQWNITEPLVFCVVSTHNFGTNCKGAAVPTLKPDRQWKCQGDRRFCGFDVDVWQCVTLSCIYDRISTIACCRHAALCGQFWPACTSNSQQRQL